MADYWMKLYIEILDDPKMATLPDRVWRRIIELFLVAKRLNKDGHIPDTRQIAWMLRMSPDELESDMAQIVHTGIIEREVNGWYIPKFSQRQAATPDAERKAQQREREKTRQYYGNVTDASRNVTQRQNTEDREQNTETKAEAEDDAPFMSANPLSVAFSKESGIASPAGDPRKWIEACEKMLELGISEDDVRQATHTLIQKGYTVIGPSSVVNAAINLMTRRKQGEPKEHISEKVKVILSNGEIVEAHT